MYDDTKYMIQTLRKFGIKTGTIARQLGVAPSVISGYVHPKPGISKINDERYYKLRKFYKEIVAIRNREVCMEGRKKTLFEDFGTAESLEILKEYTNLGLYRTMTLQEYVELYSTKVDPHPLQTGLVLW